jgi:hypothetical protein
MDGILIKYGEEEHLKQIVNGSLRFSPSEVYVKMEEEQHNKGQGDMLDGKSLSGWKWQSWASDRPEGVSTPQPDPVYH